MPLSDEDTVLIKNSYQFSEDTDEIFAENCTKGKTGSGNVTKKIQETGSIDERHACSRLKHARIEENVTFMNKLVAF